MSRFARRFMSLALVVLFATLFFPAATDSILRAADGPMVSASWLAGRLGHEPMALLHVGDRAEFEAGHIKGAQLITLPDIWTPTRRCVCRWRPGLPARDVCPPWLTDATRIVLYFGKIRSPRPRVSSSRWIVSALAIAP